jgi:hypothetical protein
LWGFVLPGYYAVLGLTLGLTRTRKAADITIAPYWYESAHIDGNTRFLGSPTPTSFRASASTTYKHCFAQLIGRQ